MKTEELLKITTRDKLLFAWRESTELARDFETYSHEIKDDDAAAETFARFAETEAVHAAKLLGMLRLYK